MKKVHCAILLAEILSYGLIVTFIFADTMFDFTGILRVGGDGFSPGMAATCACLVALVGTVNVWLTFYYMHKAHTMRDWVVICAWTQRIKSGNRWLRFEDFLTENFGCQVSHGLSEEAFHKMRAEIDSNWRALKTDGEAAPGTIEKRARDDDPAQAPGA